MKDPNYFETQIPKQDDYRMTKDLDPSLRETIKTIQGFDSDEQLDKHLDDVINNCNLHVFFDIIENEFNQYLNCNHKFVFSTWHNKFHLECQQHENQIFMSSSFVASLLCYYAYILYQADNMDNKQIKLTCFQNILGIIKDSCLWDCDPIAINAFNIVLEEISTKGNYLSLAGVLVNTSICFVWLHEMAHFYLKHDEGNKSVSLELDADKLAYEILLSIIDKNKRGEFDGKAFTSSFQEYAYLSPAMFIGFLQATTLVDKILFNKTIQTSKFEDFIKRKESIIDYIEDSNVDINTKEGNNLYGAYEDSLDAFARALVATERDGLLERFKNGGWELFNAQTKLKRKFSKKQEQTLIDDISLLFDIEYNTIANSITGIAVPATGSLFGKSIRISNIKFNLPELLKSIITLSAQIGSDGPLSYLLITVELISTIYNKANKFLNETECAILLTLKGMNDNNLSKVSEITLLEQTQKEYPDITNEDFYKGISKLTHIDCIEIVDGNVKLIDIVFVRYDY